MSNRYVYRPVKGTVACYPFILKVTLIKGKCIKIVQF